VTDAPTERDGENTWTRLTRRKVVQWGIAYLAGAWGLLQGIGFAADAFAWPSAIKQLALLLLLIGLPIVLVVAWYHGDRGEQHVTGTELAIVTLLFVLGGVIFWRYEHATAPPSAAPPLSATTTADAPRSMSSTTKLLPDRPSLAVLPFDSLGGSSENTYFADGMTDDIITDLSKLSGILVIARNSSWTYKGKSVKVQQVAKDLGVRYVLEGSVRREGDTVRINAQPIDALGGQHLWA
jgi:TolB-like protein